ncbi:MAG: acyl-CoA dehydrogenase family protein, partial [Nocardioidaceae bacterium]
FLGRVVDIGAELFAMAAVCTRAEMLKREDPASGRAAFGMAAAFCEQSRRRVELLFDELWHNTDASDRHVAARVLHGTMTWLEDGVIDSSEGTGPWISTWEPGASTRPDLHRPIG